MATYSDLLKDVRWQKKRLETLDAARWECENCGADADTLHVHHKRYFKGRKPWEYERDELAVLCEPCHQEEHDDEKLLNQVLARAPVGSVGRIAALGAGYLDGTVSIDDPAFAEYARQLFPGSFELGVVASVIDYLGYDYWRQFVRDFASKHSVAPAVSDLIAIWDEQSAEKKAV